MPSKNTIISSLFWKFFERCGTQLIQFFLTIILARVLAPNDFGLVALVTVFITFANVFVQSGLNTALIQKKNSDNLDFSTVFIASIGMAAILYIILFFCAPFIAHFYNNETLIPVIRVLSITLFLGAINSVQIAYISKNMLFKKLFYRSLGAMIPSGILGVIFALAHFGVWALVIQQLSNVFFAIVIMWFTVPWRPKMEFSFSRLKGLFSFGWKLLCSAIIDTGYNNLTGLIIGKMFSPADLAYYNRGEHFPNFVVNNINSSIQSVMLPSLSAHQDDKPQMKRLMRRAIKTSSFVIIPLMTGLAVLAKPVVLLLLGEKWLPSVPFIQVYCFIYLLYPIHTSNLSAINAMGRSDIFLKLEIIKKCIGLSFLIGGLYYFKSPIGIAYGASISTLINAFVNANPNKKLMGYGYFEQIKDIFPSFFVAVPMGACVYAVGLLNLPILPGLCLQTLCGIIFYFSLAKIFKLESFDYLLNTVKEFRNGRK